VADTSRATAETGGSTTRRRVIGRPSEPPILSAMRVEFLKSERNGRYGCRWTAIRGKRTVVPGTSMAAGKSIPHDLAQYVIEAATTYSYGFWGLIAEGATFKSTGRRVTKPGRGVIADHRTELLHSEKLAGLYLSLWVARQDGPVTDALDAAWTQWKDLALEKPLVFHWRSAYGTIEDA